MAETYTKLFNTIVTSTIWQEDKDTKILWITILAVKDADGYIDASIPGLAKLAGLSIEETNTALDKLLAPDPYSRTKDYEGRRITEVDGGWLVLNHQKYRDIRNPEKRRLQNREAQRKYREKHKQSKQEVADDCLCKPKSAHTDTDTDTDTDITTTSPPLEVEEFKEYWNNKSNLPQIKVMSKKRTNCLRTRMKEAHFKENWKKAIDKVDASDFCTGKVKRKDKAKPWVADVDWLLLTDTNYLKALEGKYDNAAGDNPYGTHEATEEEAEDLLRRAGLL